MVHASHLGCQDAAAVIDRVDGDPFAAFKRTNCRFNRAAIDRTCEKGYFRLRGPPVAVDRFDSTTGKRCQPFVGRGDESGKMEGSGGVLGKRGDRNLDDRGAAIEGRVANGDQFGILCSGGIPDDGGVDAADLHGIGCIGDRWLDDGGVFFDSEPVARGREEAAGFFTDGRGIRISEGIPHLASG